MKRAIGIDINKKYVSLVQLCYKRNKLFLEKCCVQEIANNAAHKEDYPAIIQEAIKEIITKEDFDTKSPATISMPFGKVFFHNYRTEFSAGNDIERLIKFELEDDFPIPFDDIVTEICGGFEINEQEKEFLISAVSRSELHKWSQTTNDSGIDCSIVTSDVCAINSLIAHNSKANHDDPSIIVYIDDYKIITIVNQNNLLKVARHIENISTKDIATSLKQEIFLTLKAISDTAKPLPSKILICGSKEKLQNLKKELSKEIDLEIEIANLFEIFDTSSLRNTDNKLTIAMGLALIGLDTKYPAINFLAADKIGIEEKNRTKRNAVVFVLLLISIAAIFFANFFNRLKSLENENKNLESDIRQIFVQTFPDETYIVDELAQMNEKYLELEKNSELIASEISDDIPILETLEEVSKNITPEQNIKISSITINRDSTQLSATAPDFESVDKLVEKLEQIQLFESIEIKNPDIDPMNDRVRFGLLIKTNVNN